jgi:hypothetical protein
MNSASLRLLALAVLAAVAPACGGGNVPDCLVFTPVHATSGGQVDVGTLAETDVAVDVIEIETTAIEGAPGTGVFVEVVSSCDDPDCTPDFSCAPGTLDTVGDTITCDVSDAITGASCSWSCQVRLTATVLDEGVCRDVFALVDVVGLHDDLAVGR